ncbi:MAG: cysteine protease, partial [Finegoldia magna]|nr:cysteine protease [Finegoldia magna]
QLTLESSDQNIASVNNSMVVCNNPGKVKIIAKSTDGSNVSNFAVIYVEGDSPESKNAVNIKSNAYRNSISIGNTNNISAIVTDSNKRNIRNAKVKFTINKPSKKMIEKELTTNYRGQSILYLKANELDEVGNYNVNISATDSKGNTNEDNLSFEVKDNRATFETKVDLKNAEIKLNQNAIISVTCKNNSLRISDANVVLSITDENDNKQEKRFRTDRYGNCYYTFRPVSKGRYYIEATVSKNGYKNSSGNTTLIVNDSENKPETKQTVKLKFETDKKSYNISDTANIKIFATDENGKKISNLKLSVRIRNQKGFDRTIEKITDSNGVAKMLIKQPTTTSQTDYTIEAWPVSNPNTSFDLKISFGSSNKLEINSIYSSYNLYSKYNNNYVIHNYIRNIR